jgi:hypothetical protein
MNLRNFIERAIPLGPVFDRPTLATVATPATVDPFSARAAETVATVATVAALGEPESWPDRIRSLSAVEGVSWDMAADALGLLLSAGVVEKALGLGWDARELVGVQRRQPHGAPHCAGLIFSVRAGDTVTDVRRSGCIIAYGNIRHIWKRAPLPLDGSICLPWELAK